MMNVLRIVSKNASGMTSFGRPEAFLVSAESCTIHGGVQCTWVAWGCLYLKNRMMANQIRAPPAWNQRS